MVCSITAIRSTLSSGHIHNHTKCIFTQETITVCLHCSILNIFNNIFYFSLFVFAPCFPLFRLLALLLAPPLKALYVCRFLYILMYVPPIFSLLKNPSFSETRHLMILPKLNWLQDQKTAHSETPYTHQLCFSHMMPCVLVVQRKSNLAFNSPQFALNLFVSDEFSPLFTTSVSCFSFPPLTTHSGLLIVRFNMCSL